MSGVLYGIGLGPGDPELLTLKAARLIRSAAVLAYPASPGAESFARAIAADQIAEGAVELRIEVPMQVDRGPAQAAYDKAAAEIGAALDLGQDVAFLCEGDPLFYGSFMYVLARLAADHRVEVVPGITSVSAAAAALGRPLVARNASLSVLPGPLEDAALRAAITAAGAVAILKVGRHMARLKALVSGMGLAERAFYVERATLPEGRAMPLAEAPDEAPYFSMILILKGDDPWL
ncbi:MAG: precorrin-2 C(20)-methyltransferase [Rhodobacteraceae bacterium]|nr:precorrin-2 C(20)-methyltransferase [Paracoccaceae bacterium]